MDISGKNIAVIGGAGFIGSHIVELLLEEEVARVVVLDNLYRGRREHLEEAASDPRMNFVEADILDSEQLTRHLDGCDGVIHLAAAWLLECLERPRFAVENNIMGTFNVMEACHRASVGKVVFSSSASVYGDAIETPMTEEHPYNNRTLYGATKIAGEHLFRAFNEMYDLDYVGLRYMNVYGPRQDYRGVYTSVIMKILDRLDEGKPPIVYGDGSQTYDFVYVGDVARANILALASSVTDRFFNVGTGVGTSLKKMAEFLLHLTGVDLPIQYEPAGQTFVTRRVAAVDQACKELGFVAQVPLEEGLAELIRWRKSDIVRLVAQG